jgi:hypothetical protein
MSRKIEAFRSSSKKVIQNVIDSAKNVGKENAAIGTVIGSGAAATVTGVVAAGTSTTAAISAAGATIGGVAGGIVGAVTGSSIGLVTGGAGMAATVPLAATGAALGTTLGGYAGTAAALVGIGTAPAWAVPMAVAGGVAMTGGATVAAYKFYKHKQKKVEIQSSDSSETSIVESSVSVALSEKQMKQIAELEKAHQEGFLSDVDFEKRVNDIKECRKSTD